MAVQPDDVLAVTMIHDHENSGEQINRFQFRLVSSQPVDEADMLDDIAVLMALLYGIVEGLISVRNVFREATVFNATQLTLLGSTDAGAYVGGIATGDDLPHAAAPFCYFKTNIPHVILSKYLPSGTEITTSLNGGLTAAAQASVVDFADELMQVQVLPNSTLQFGYFSSKTLAWEVPVLAVVPQTLAYQRRRKVGRGA